MKLVLLVTHLLYKTISSDIQTYGIKYTWQTDYFFNPVKTSKYGVRSIPTEILVASLYINKQTVTKRLILNM